MKLMDTVKNSSHIVEKALAITPEKKGDMDILDKLHKEHEEVKALLKQLVESESAPTRKSLLKKVKLALVPHARAEEKVVYDPILRQKDKEAKINGEEGYLEHALADKMVLTLSKIRNATSPEFTAAAKVLKELIEHHIKEEESDIWKDVREYFNDEERIEMNRKFELAKKKVRVA
ncbi:MAG: hemerythrin domain-containing protein [Alphaproteobacteria bacterium]